MRVPTATLVDGGVVPRLIVGGWQLSAGHRKTPKRPREVLEDLVSLVGDGVFAFDCADIYTGVESLFGDLRRLCAEELGGEAARALRVHTKLVPDRARLAQVDRRYVERVVDRSLARLGVDRLDLVQLAWWNYAIPGYVDTALWLEELRRAGKVRSIGVTNFDGPRLREILDAGVPVITNQVQCSVLDHRPESTIQRLCAEHGIALLCYGTLAGGFLSDRYLGVSDPGAGLPNRSLTKYRLIIDEFGGWAAYQEMLRVLRSAADDLGCSVAQAALAYVAGRPGVVAAVVGMTRVDRIREAVLAMDLSLPSIHVERVRRLAASAPGPDGDCFGLERIEGSRHAAIMRYDLNADLGP